METKVISKRHFQIELNLMSNSDPRYAQPSLLLWQELHPWIQGRQDDGLPGGVLNSSVTALSLQTQRQQVLKLDFAILLHIEVLLTLLGILSSCRIKWTEWIRVKISSGFYLKLQFPENSFFFWFFKILNSGGNVLLVLPSVETGEKLGKDLL